MQIPTNLKSKKVSRSRLIRIIRAQQRAIKEECKRCMGVTSLRGVKDCEGSHLDDGNCPLYGFRPWSQ